VRSLRSIHEISWTGEADKRQCTTYAYLTAVVPLLVGPHRDEV